MKRIIAATLLLVASTADAAQSTQAYLCIPDLSVGVAFNKVTKHWEEANFNIRATKYLLKKAPNGWNWTEFSSPTAVSQCPEFNSGGSLVCDAFPQEIWFNPRTMRFQTFYYAGYTAFLGEEGGDTPNIQIGTCAPL